MGMNFSVQYRDAIIKAENFARVTGEPMTADEVAEYIATTLGSEDPEITDTGDVDISGLSFTDHASYGFGDVLTEILRSCEPGAILEWLLDTEEQDVPQWDRLERDGTINSYFGAVLMPVLPPLDPELTDDNKEESR